MSSLKLELKRFPGRYVFEIAGRFELVKAAVDVGEFDPVVPWDNIPGGVVFQMLRFNKPDVTKVDRPISVLYGVTSVVSECYL